MNLATAADDTYGLNLDDCVVLVGKIPCDDSVFGFLSRVLYAYTIPDRAGDY